MRRKNQSNWIALMGKISHSVEGIKYIPSLIMEGPNKGQHAVCLAKSNYDFENGSVAFTVKLEDPNNYAQVGFNHGVGTEVYAGISAGGSSYSIFLFSNNKWETLSSAGF